MFEWGNETNPGAALYVGEEGLSEGGELTVYSDQFNGQLLLHSGHVWDERRASAPEVRLSSGELSSSEMGSRDAGVEARRAELLAARNLSHVMDFSLQSDELPAGLLPWLRLALATSAQVEAATAPEAFDAPLSTASERLAVQTLHVTLDRTLAEYDFDVEEDEQLLEGLVGEAARVRCKSYAVEQYLHGRQIQIQKTDAFLLFGGPGKALERTQAAARVRTVWGMSWLGSIPPRAPRASPPLSSSLQLSDQV